MVANFDVRERLYNDPLTGPAQEIQLARVAITRLHGFVVDLDPDRLVEDNQIFPPDTNPGAFFEKVRPVLDRHPLLRHAEIRNTGRGLHALVLLDPPVELHSEQEQSHWDAVIRTVQATVPADFNAPGITAVTRPVGAINTKNGATVKLLKKGEPVPPQAVLDFLTRVQKAPFRELMEIWFGASRVEPCPVCGGEGTSLGVFEQAGRCYNCGKLGLDRIFPLMLKPPPEDKKEEAKSAPSGTGTVAAKAEPEKPAVAETPTRTKAGTRSRAASPKQKPPEERKKKPAREQAKKKATKKATATPARRARGTKQAV